MAKTTTICCWTSRALSIVVGYKFMVMNMRSQYDAWGGSCFVKLLLTECLYSFIWWRQRRPSLWGNDAFPSVSDFPLFLKIFPTWPFSPKNFAIFIRQNFWWPVLVVDSEFRISSYFRKILHFSPISGTFLFPRVLFQISPVISSNLRIFYTHYVFFFPPSLTMMHPFSLWITQCT